MWQDNLELLSAYFVAAQEILSQERKPLALLDISTGPCLAPLMAIMQCVETAILSDYEASNREAIVSSDIAYWKRYAEELAQMFPDHALDAQKMLTRLDALRKMHRPLDVDLRRDPVFIPDIVKHESVELMTMHFVVDSICDTAQESFALLDKALSFIKPNGWLLISALIESKGWSLGHTVQPSPYLKEQEFDEFFDANNMQIVNRVSSKPKHQQIYDGRWTVFLTKKRNQ